LKIVGVAVIVACRRLKSGWRITGDNRALIIFKHHSQLFSTAAPTSLQWAGLRLANQVIGQRFTFTEECHCGFDFAVRREAIARLRIACRASPTSFALTELPPAGSPCPCRRALAHCHERLEHRMFTDVPRLAALIHPLSWRRCPLMMSPTRFGRQPRRTIGVANLPLTESIHISVVEFQIREPF